MFPCGIKCLVRYYIGVKSMKQRLCLHLHCHLQRSHICAFPFTRSALNFTGKGKTHSKSEPDSTTSKTYKEALESTDKKNKTKSTMWQNIRYEIQIDHEESASESKDGILFRVLSYNILSQYLMQLHPYLYEYHDSEFLDWNTRSCTLMREIKEANADIICLQEVESTHLNFFSHSLGKLGYEGIYKKRTNDKLDGCAIYFKMNRFVLRERACVEYHQPGSYLNRDNVGIMARLGLKQEGLAEFVVATTHLLFNPRRDDIRLAQVQMLLAEVERVAFKTRTNQGPLYHPIILTGDFNLEPFSSPYEFITRGFLEADTTQTEILPKHFCITDDSQHANVVKNRGHSRCKSDYKGVKLFSSDRPPPPSNGNEENFNFGSGVIRHGLKLASVYPHSPPLQDCSTFQDEWLTVDYIFYGTENENRLKPISYLKLPSKFHAENIIKTIPNENCSSDHFPLLATFKLLPDKTSNSK